MEFVTEERHIHWRALGNSWGSAANIPRRLENDFCQWYHRRNFLSSAELEDRELSM